MHLSAIQKQLAEQIFFLILSLYLFFVVVAFFHLSHHYPRRFSSIPSREFAMIASRVGGMTLGNSCSKDTSASSINNAADMS